MLQARGDTARAVDELAALAALEPERAERAVAVGAAYLRAGRHDAAVLALGRAAERFPESSAVFAALGAVWLRAAETGDAVALEKALAALARAAALDGPSGETFLLLGRVRVLAGDLEGAERDLRRAVERLPAPPEAFARLADVLERRRLWPEARQALIEYAALTSGTPAFAAVAPRIGALSMRDRRSARRRVLVREGDGRGRPLGTAAATGWRRPSSTAARQAGPASSSRRGWASSPATTVYAPSPGPCPAADAGRLDASTRWPAGAARRCRPAAAPVAP